MRNSSPVQKVAILKIVDYETRKIQKRDIKAIKPLEYE